ncbi:unnamed protein product [Durusdinium trenchii]|uniref:Uncharacterized protein n=1 Tax=Durusdinium trenchii TaxID=1381693 RepID=A0ABP0RB19_9DINO
MFDRPAVYSLKSHVPPLNYSGLNGKSLFWQQLAASYRYLPETSAFIQCAQSRWRNHSDCMPAVAMRRYQEYWANLRAEEYDICCQPSKADKCKEPKLKDGLPLCGFPFGSVDHLPAFLPELQLSLPSGPLRLLQGIGDEVFFGSDLESRLLWSTALAVYVDLQLGKEIVESRSRPRAVDLGAGVGLTCLVLMRRGVDVACTDVDDAALILSSQNAAAFVAESRQKLWQYGSLRVLRFNYSSGKDTWRDQGVVPPYDVVVMGASPQGELRKNLNFYAKLFRELGHPGTRVFLEDQGHREVTCAVPPDLEASRAFAQARDGSKGKGLGAERSIKEFLTRLHPCVWCERLVHQRAAFLTVCIQIMVVE